MTPDQSSSPSLSLSIRSSAYEVITTSAAATASPIGAPRLDSDSVRQTTRRSGANLAASLDQFDTTLVGATTRNGGCVGTYQPGLADQCERLEGLAQAHVVGEDAAQLMAPQEVEPAVSVELVRPERGAQGLREPGRPRST